MKLLYKGMKKVKFFLGSEKVPFGYEKKPVFENFPFHTLGYENFGCFFLMSGAPFGEGWAPRRQESLQLPGQVTTITELEWQCDSVARLGDARDGSSTIPRLQ